MDKIEKIIVTLMVLATLGCVFTAASAYDSDGVKNAAIGWIVMISILGGAFIIKRLWGK